MCPSHSTLKLSQLYFYLKFVVIPRVGANSGLSWSIGHGHTPSPQTIRDFLCSLGSLSAKWGWKQGGHPPQMRAVPGHGFSQPPALLTKAGCPLGFKIESITTSIHTLTLEDTPCRGGEAPPGRIGPIITLIIYFSPHTPKSAREEV